ncbi:MAG: hypothetical protein DMF81_08855 [Acidobacteria bacterium]|nr:MAG: hypothetical protein DMF81_08855 [Acidobacteriota bacterium]
MSDGADGTVEPRTPFPTGAEAEPGEGGEQKPQGLGPRYQRVATLLTRLASTARSFLLYDAGNEAINRSLSALLDSALSTLQVEGQIALTVQPYELKFEDQTVYLNRDRERSLAFRLYRDGVRGLTFRKGFQAEELTRLLEILSIRYTGVNQREDDMVTLLWKARFEHLDVTTVEGIVPEETDAGDEETASSRRLVLPDDVDLPRPTLPPPKGPTWIDVPPERLRALREEAGEAALPDDCLALLGRLRRALSDSKEQLPFGEVAHLFGEVRDYLLSVDRLPALKRFGALLWEMAGEETPEWDPQRHAAVYDLLDSCGHRRAVRRLLRSVPAEERKLRPELIEVLDRVCPDPLVAVMETLDEEEGLATRAVARQALEHYSRRKPGLLEQRFLLSRGRMASDLLRVMAHVGGEASVAFVAQQCLHPDAAVQDEALWHIARTPYSGVLGRSLFEAFRRADPDRRSRILEIVARSGDARFLEPLTRYVEERGDGLGTDEASRIGRVLGILGGPESIARWKAWLQPAGGRRKGFEAPLPRIVAAATALAFIRAEAAAEALGAAFDEADETSQPWILGALAQRQRQAWEAAR